MGCATVEISPQRRTSSPRGSCADPTRIFCSTVSAVEQLVQWDAADLREGPCTARGGGGNPRSCQSVAHLNKNPD